MRSIPGAVFPEDACSVKVLIQMICGKKILCILESMRRVCYINRITMIELNILLYFLLFRRVEWTKQKMWELYSLKY